MQPVSTTVKEEKELCTIKKSPGFLQAQAKQ